MLFTMCPALWIKSWLIGGWGRSHVMVPVGDDGTLTEAVLSHILSECELALPIHEANALGVVLFLQGSWSLLPS